MIERIKDLSREEIEQAIQLFNRSMDDYLYVMDIDNDYYCISQHAIERFQLPDYHFDHAATTFKTFVYHEDFEALAYDLKSIKNGLKTIHNMQYRWIDKDGHPLWINCRGILIETTKHAHLLIGCVNEIGKKQVADNVSGLLSEASLDTFMKGKMTPLNQGFIIQIGIDDYDIINGRLGFKFGESLFKYVAERIVSNLQFHQYLFKTGSNHFLLVDLMNHHVDEVIQLYKRLRNEMEKLIEESQYKAVFTLSAGIVDLGKINYNYDSIIKYSEFALNEAKKHGNNSYCVFDYEAYNSFLKKRRIRRELQNSINHDFKGFDVYYQPIVDAYTRKIKGAEALMRFHIQNENIDEWISPIEFIPLLEESGLIIPVGKWILDKAVSSCKQWQENIPSFKINVNLSYVQVNKSNILNEIIKVIKTYDLNPSSLGIEVTESGFLENTMHFQKLWNKLRNLGITLILDDYGTGYSNAYRLGNLTPHYIKIDRSLTIKALTNDYEKKILINIIDMAHSLGLSTCVEGIETEEEYQGILKLHPDYIQGYLFGKPVNKEEFEKMIKKTT